VIREVASSTPGRFAVRLRPWASCFNACASLTKKYNLVPVVMQRCPTTGKVSVGLASHWPCVTDLSSLSTYGVKALVREMSTPPTLLVGYGTLTFIHVYHEFQQRKTYQNFGLDALHLCNIWKYLLTGSIFIRSRYRTWSKIYHNRVVRLPKFIANMWSGHQVADGRIRYHTTINIASVGDATSAISHAAAEVCTQRLATGRGHGYRLAVPSLQPDRGTGSGPAC